MSDLLTLDDLRHCFGGLVPSVIATASARGVPNVTYLSRAHPVDAERIAISNQFLSKSSRNLAENPVASLLLVDPETFGEYRVSAVYERTERRGPIFDRLRNDLAMIASLTGMQDVFRLAAADIYRVTNIERLHTVGGADDEGWAPVTPVDPGPLGELCARISRCSDLDALVNITVEGVADLLGFEHAQLLLLDEAGERLFTIASNGYPAGGIGAEVEMGEGVIGRAAAACAPEIIGSLGQLRKYARSMAKALIESGAIGPGHEIPMIGLEHPGSQMAVPALSLGQLVGVLFVEDERPLHFRRHDAVVLSIVTSLVASAVESLRTDVRAPSALEPAAVPKRAAAGSEAVRVRHFTVDGSTFFDGDYVIKGVAGRLLWSLLRQYVDEGRTEFTNREVRLDSSLELPDFRDNFESRLILLKRRLDDRTAPIRIEKTGRGRFHLVVDASPQLELVADA